MKINKEELKEDVKDLLKYAGKTTLQIGLAAAVLIGADRACHEIGKHIHFPEVETAEITDATFYRQATITFRGPDYIENRAIFIYDNYGKTNELEQTTAEEAFECPYRYSEFEGTYRALGRVPVKEWKHYVVPGVGKPLVSNNINQMTPEQRDFYSKILNMYHENVVKQK